MGYYEQIISMDGKASAKVRSDRRLMLNSALMLMAGGVLFVPVAIDIAAMLVVSGVIGFLSCLATIIALMRRVPISTTFFRVIVVIWAISMLLTDLALRARMNNPPWPLFVLLADLSLMLRLGRGFATGLIAAVAVWVMITWFESTIRFGLYDLPGTSSTEERWEVVRRTLDCEVPPCPVKATNSGSELFITLLVLIIDFLATRGFASQAEKEQASMEKTIATVEAIAKLLAGYDVDTVTEMLQEAEAEGRLPAAMHEALRRLEHNLRAYRPYLPAVLLEQQQHSPGGAGLSRSSVAVAPGVNSERAAIAFTDIRSSTSIWEAAPEAMKKAMKTHNAVMRGEISAWGGYEVKTIGDAFMVAFEKAHAGVCFGLAVQEKLLAAEWPVALLEVPICRATGLWGGLTVRVGVNEGPVTLETNALTGRVDYFGHTVNVAARLESVCVPGAVAVPAQLWASVRDMPECVGAHAGAAVQTELKGVSECLPVCSVWPACLQGRESRPLFAAPGAASRRGSGSSSRSRSNDSRLQDSLLHHSTTSQEATVAVATFSSMGIGQFNSQLAGVVPLLQQSGGVLLSLIGNNFFIGWNVGKQIPAHAEGALRFAQRVMQHGDGLTVSTLGVASGTVEHGDVGTVQQRFVTASGGAVEASLALRHLAISMHRRCLYTAEAPPGAVRELLRATTARLPQGGGPGRLVYEVQWHA